MLFVTTGLYAQIQKMSELSKNKFLDSKIIYEDNGEDVWGYFLLTQADKISKDVLQLEYIILDKNLNKLGSNTFQHDYYNSWLIDVYPNINCIIKNKDELLLAVGYDLDVAYQTNPYAFRKISLKDYSIGNMFIFLGDKKIEDNKIIDKLTEAKEDPTQFFPLGSQGLIRFNSEGKKKKVTNTGGKESLNETNIKPGYTFFDLDFNKKWSYEYADIENGGEGQRILASKNNTMVFLKEYFGKAFKKKDRLYYRIVDKNTGTEINTIPLFDSNYTYSSAKIVFDNDNVILFDKIYEYSSDAIVNLDKCLGYSKRVFNITSKSVTEQKILFWTDLSKYIEINKNGRVGSWDYIQFLDIKITSDGKTLMIGEGYEPAKNSKTKNMYALEMDKDFKVKSFTEILKNKNSFTDLYAWGDRLESLNAFDFMYSQKIKEDEFVYYYQDNEKSNGILKDLKADKWILGVITYADGEFKTQKINLKTKKGNIIPNKAKKGYIILQEVSKTENEIRLEKIEY